MRPIEYLTGDATRPLLTDGETAIIAHCCNNVGAWGAGFSGAVSKRWKEPEAMFRQDSKTGLNELGFVTFVPVGRRLFVANIYGQNGIGTNRQRVVYDALRHGLRDVAGFTHGFEPVSVHMPRIGCGLAGGSWPEVERIVIDELCMSGVRVCVYGLPATRKVAR